MARELIVATNPARRKKRTVSAKQRAAARRNIKKAQAARRRGLAPKRRTSTAARRAPAAKRRRAPARRTARRTARRATRRTYSNPVKLIPRNLVPRYIMPAVIGGAGAVANNAAYSMLLSRIPATGAAGELIENFRTGPLRHAGHAISALGLTWLASFAVKRQTAEQLGAGALTVVGFNMVSELAGKVFPNLTLGAYIQPALGYAGAGRTAHGRLPPRTGSNMGKRAGLAAYIRPERARQLSQRGQLQQNDPYRAAPSAPAPMEGYGY